MKKVAGSIYLLVVLCWFAPANGLAQEEDARERLRRISPVAAGRIEGTVATIQGETLKQSLVLLSEVDLYYSSAPHSEAGMGVAHWIPIPDHWGKADLNAIMSNRRFRKVFGELRAMDKGEVTAMMNSELSAAIEEYVPLYETEVERMAPHYKVENRPSKEEGRPRMIVGPTFIIGSPNGKPGGKVVIAGARLKVLALVWMAGMLELEGCQAQVERVTRLAIKQRTEMYRDSSTEDFFRASMLNSAGVYNRQIIGTGLLGVAGNKTTEASTMKVIQAEWQERTLVSYESAVTEYDLAARVIKPDHSTGGMTVKHLSPLNDENFDLLMRKVHFAE